MKRCQYQIYEKHKFRKCKKVRLQNHEYCTIHLRIAEDEVDDFLSGHEFSDSLDGTIGKCCFCNDECNPCSQSCGICARQMTGYALGWYDTTPIFHQGVYRNVITDH